MKLSSRFKKDFSIFSYRLFIIVFWLCVWYSLSMFISETLHIGYYVKDENPLVNGTLTMITTGIGLIVVLWVISELRDAIRSIYNYIFKEDFTYGKVREDMLQCCKETTKLLVRLNDDYPWDSNTIIPVVLGLKTELESKTSSGLYAYITVTMDYRFKIMFSKENKLPNIRLNVTMEEYLKEIEKC